MAGLVSRYEGEYLTARGDGFFTLARSVVGQQISVKAADAVWSRVMQAVQPMTAETWLATPDETLRSCGLSGSKVVYARNVAAFYQGKEVSPQQWVAHSDAEVIRELTAIKGIGVWTAEMFLIFHLLRPDVFPLLDIGLLKAVDQHYTNGVRLTRDDYRSISTPWQPYRTVATWYLWRALDPIPVEY